MTYNKAPRFADARATLNLAWPIMVTQLAQIGTSFVDATMAGHYSPVDLAAISVGGSIWVALMVTLIGLTLAEARLSAQRTGETPIVLLDEIAAHLGTINYEIVCMVGKRVPRVYVE